MCHFITAIIDDKSSLETLNSIGKNYGITFRTVSNEHLQKQLQYNRKYLWKNSDQCDCGTSIGSSRTSDPVESTKKDIKRFKKKGWSETKIKNWLMNRERSEKKDERAELDRGTNVNEDAKNWIGLLRDFQNSSEIGYFGLLLHWYSGNVESEPVNILDWRKINPERLTTSGIFEMEEDVVYQI